MRFDFRAARELAKSEQQAEARDGGQIVLATRAHRAGDTECDQRPVRGDKRACPPRVGPADWIEGRIEPEGAKSSKRFVRRGLALVLSLIEPAFVARGSTVGLSIHNVYTLVFVPATLVVGGAGGLALGLGLRDHRLALAARAGAAAAAAFVVVDLAMDAIGRRVGADRSARRSIAGVRRSRLLNAARAWRFKDRDRHRAIGPARVTRDER
jgi:hypothetical protein